jgi:hypothetical protein
MSPAKSSRPSFRLAVGKYFSFFLLFVLVIVLFGWPQYAFATLRCGRQPVIASRFAAAYSYSVPGDKTYTPDVFSEYFCSTGEAEKHGFHPSPLR